MALIGDVQEVGRVELVGNRLHGEILRSGHTLPQRDVLCRCYFSRFGVAFESRRFERAAIAVELKQFKGRAQHRLWIALEKLLGMGCFAEWRIAEAFPFVRQQRMTGIRNRFLLDAHTTGQTHERALQPLPLLGE